MLPPPAPIVCTSIIGSRSGMRKSRLVSSATLGSPSMITATSKLVPPMSPVITWLKPASAAMRAAAVTPAAGPERTMYAARLPSWRSGATPPLVCMIATSRS